MRDLKALRGEGEKVCPHSHHMILLAMCACCQISCEGNVGKTVEVDLVLRYCPKCDTYCSMHECPSAKERAA